MSGFRSVMAPDAIELSTTQSATIPASGTVGVPVVAPTQAHGRNIVGLRLILAATVTFSVAPGASPGTVGQLIGNLRILKGTDKMFDVASIAQLIRALHIYSGQTLADVAFGSGLTSLSATLDTGVIPLHFVTNAAIQLVLTANNAATFTNGTGGSISLTAEFHYAQSPVKDDKVVIVTAASQQSSGVEINAGQQFPVTDPVKEIWLDVTADANLTYQSFAVGQTTVYLKADPTTLKSLEQYLGSVWTHIAGFLLSRAPENVIYQSPGGTNTTLPQLIAKYASALTPTYYIVLGK